MVDCQILVMKGTIDTRIALLLPQLKKKTEMKHIKNACFCSKLRFLAFLGIISLGGGGGIMLDM